MKSPLPDRERRHKLQFYLARDMHYGTRVGLGAGLMLAGLLVQLLLGADVHAAALTGGLALLFTGTLFFLVQGYDLAPRRQTGSGDWEKTTMDRFSAALKHEDEVRSWDDTFVDVTCVSGAFSLFLLIVGVAFACALLGQERELYGWAHVLGFDAAVLLLPHWFTGTRRGWKPLVLRSQIEALGGVLRTIKAYDHPPCQIQPMFEMLGKGKQRTPVQARVFVRFPEGPEELLGVQFQVSMNNVQGTQYPYLYTVIVARKSFRLISRHRKVIENCAKGLTVECNTEEDVQVVVIRQHTTRTSGYHTKPAAVRKIASAAWNAVTEVLARELAGKK